MEIRGHILNGKVSFVDEEGRMVTPYVYDMIGGDYVEGLMLVKRDGKYGYIDTNAKEIIPCIYDEAASFFKNGLTWVRKYGKSGYIDNTGKEIVPLDFYPRAFEIDFCQNAEEVIKCSDMIAVRERYEADYAIQHATTEQEINEIIENYQKEMDKLIDKKTARLFAVMNPQEKREVLKKAKQKAKSKIDKVFEEYQEPECENE